jgi:mersacidin/lichenicidin family type 2 lantibiotic
MLPGEIVRAWKDEEHRTKLSEFAQSAAPDNPASSIGLADEEIAGIEGGTIETTLITITTLFITIVTCGITMCTCVMPCDGLEV